jgi:hypothetical protein
MPRSSRRTWVEDIVEYFGELGGEAHYSELYRHIEQNPRRQLGASWQAVVRRTIEQHSSDSTIWSKFRLPDLFRSVNGLGQGTWALRNPSVGRNHFILRSNADSPWNDADGVSYEFGRTVPNWTRVKPGDEALIERIVDGQHYLIGVATIGSVTADQDGKFVARYSNYENFVQPIPLPQTFAASISAMDGYNPQHSISIVPEFLFLPLLDEARTAERVLMASEEVRGPTYERGGGEAPKRRAIGDKPPRASNKELAKSDPEARRQALERRQSAHHDLLLTFRDRCGHSNIDVDCTQYADALAAGWIFEMKTIQGDAVAQIRAALGQLYHYLFLHRDLPGYGEAGLCIVLDKGIDQQLLFFLVAKANISVAWLGDGHFVGAGRVLEALPWLFDRRREIAV